jgi:CAAX protease family protein
MSEDIPPRPDGLRPRDGPPPPDGQPPEQAARPLATWQWWEALAVYLGGVLLVGLVTLPVLAGISSRGTARLVSSILAAAGLVAVLVFWLQRFHPRWRQAIGFPRRLGPEIRAGLAFGLGLYPVVVLGVGLVLSLVLEAVSGEGVSAPEQLPPRLDALQVVLATVYALVLAPVHEELFFRGCLFRSLRDRHGFAVGAAGSAVAFGLVHYLPGPWQDSLLLMGVMVFTGLGLAYLYERRKTIVASLAAHVAFNVIGLTLILALR